MTPEKQAVLEKLNQAAHQEHQEALERAKRIGKPAPVKPAPLTEAEIEFPKWLHKNWGKTDKSHSLELPGDSVLAKTSEEAKEWAAKGYSEGPSGEKKVETKKEAAKKE